MSGGDYGESYEFLRILNGMLPEGTSLGFNQFPGDPKTTAGGNWSVRPLKRFADINPDYNVFLCISALKDGPRKFSRGDADVVAGLVFFIDDLGTGPGSKFPLDVIAPLPPTILIETSPSNFQAAYVYEKPVRGIPHLRKVIDGFIAKTLGGKDPGQAGVNRVFRPGIGVNGKPKYLDENGEPWRVRVTEFNPERRYSLSNITTAFGITVNREIKRTRIVLKGVRRERKEFFDSVLGMLTLSGAIKSISDKGDEGGVWYRFRCPWTDGHSGGSDLAAISTPNEANLHHGGFVCHHGTCAGKTIGDVFDWVCDDIADALEGINDGAPDEILVVAEKLNNGVGR